MDIEQLDNINASFNIREISGKEKQDVIQKQAISSHVSIVIAVH